jgi:hypothetical protein
MNLTSFHTVDYKNISYWKLGENEPKTNPIKANFYTIISAFRLQLHLNLVNLIRIFVYEYR